MGFPVFLKVTVFFGAWLGLWLPFAIPQSLLLKWRPGLPLSSQQRLPLLASLYLVAPPIALLTATLEKSTLADCGLTWDAATLASSSRGFALGVFGLVLSFALQSIAGWISWNFPDRQLPEFPLSFPSRLAAWVLPSMSILLPAFILAVWVAGTEELMFRGILQNLLQAAYPIWIAAAISSTIFALLHLLWDIRETLPQLLGLWLMGMVLVWARIVDGGSLGLAWGLHAGWVWSMVSLDTADIVRYTGQSPEWVSGISGKPLAGLLGIILLLVTGIAIGS
ncbi:MAG TPA: CPBP family intramembrane metalloprotease [Oscillatoriales cyanobacterium M59_W2019_021]|nr:MAG: CPBP family intramembrane metalloprotease [Cyanobacteria bacterium J055]HIK30832.1 CPBP family intramembrane metalloprotease [Oscillatoriales cyanobacterium M4454_W2019_049]HIK51532.1 CPBP family intramembrane metalloprotease [Oscillatoriales cyanobacterium M59_W2019_021]